jgi:hypothetical protein
MFVKTREIIKWKSHRTYAKMLGFRDCSLNDPTYAISVIKHVTFCLGLFFYFFLFIFASTFCVLFCEYSFIAFSSRKRRAIRFRTDVRFVFADVEVMRTSTNLHIEFFAIYSPVSIKIVASFVFRVNIRFSWKIAAHFRRAVAWLPKSLEIEHSIAFIARKNGKRVFRVCQTHQCVYLPEVIYDIWTVQLEIYQNV